MIAHKETCPRRHQALAEAPKKLSREDLSEASGSGKSIRSDPSLAHALEVFEEEINNELPSRLKGRQSIRELLLEMKKRMIDQHLEDANDSPCTKQLDDTLLKFHQASGSKSAGLDSEQEQEQEQVSELGSVDHSISRFCLCSLSVL